MCVPLADGNLVCHPYLHQRGQMPRLPGKDCHKKRGPGIGQRTVLEMERGLKRVGCCNAVALWTLDRRC